MIKMLEKDNDKKMLEEDNDLFIMLEKDKDKKMLEKDNDFLKNVGRRGTVGKCWKRVMMGRCWKRIGVKKNIGIVVWRC